MSKMRIYELAKELGVDNKVVLSKAADMGLGTKLSHSHSLDASEVEQIRRAIIRQPIGTAPEKETITKRVDKLSGNTDTIVEKRKGNVIRRRKQSNAEEEAGTEVSGSAALAASAGLEEPSEQVSDDTATAMQSEPSFSGGLAVVEESSTLETPAQAESSNGHPAVVASAPPASEPVVEEERKGPGPKILGRIELPQKRAARPEVKRPVAASARTDAARSIIVEPEEEDGRPAKKKTRRRELSRVDLLDYDGRPIRRGGAKSGGRVGARGEGMDESRAPVDTGPKVVKRIVKMDEAITVGELARQLSLKSGEVISKLIQLGVMATINQAIDKDTATIIAEEFGSEVQSTSFDEAAVLDTETPEEVVDMTSRPPVVTVMGHVDHGKTSLLDTIRKSSVASKEHGGITQHIGAYRVVLDDGRSITFIDTPGHAAFTSMRARGAQVTDIVVLVVAADDGVMPQTIEAINHAKAANVSILVAINKVDKPGANIDKIKQQLVEHGLQPEDWGGDTMFFGVSALKGSGIKELLEGILLLAEVKELKANAKRRAKGAIIEARQDKGRGTVATLLVQRGTLVVGDVFVTGSGYGRVRSMTDHDGERLTEAGPSQPVEITGLSEIPEAGDDFMVVESEARAREVSANRLQKKQAKELASFAGGPITLEEFAKRANNMAAAELNIILKADVHGSVEAATLAVEKLSTEKVKVKVLHAAVGGISESDVKLAVASRAIVIGFGVRAEPRVVQEAEMRGVDIRYYRVIYELIDDVKKAMTGLLAPIRKEVPLGRVEVRETFSVGKVGTIAGSFVTEGTVRRGANVRLLRDNRVIHEGKVGSLKRFKDDVREVQAGYECGVGIEGYNDVKIGDVIEFFDIEEIAPTLE